MTHTRADTIRQALEALMHDPRWLDSSDAEKAEVADEVVEWVAENGLAVCGLLADAAEQRETA